MFENWQNLVSFAKFVLFLRKFQSSMGLYVPFFQVLLWMSIATLAILQ